MQSLSLQELERFIVRAKSATYAGGGKKLLPYRLESRDLQLIDGDWAYHDSYLGERDFIGEEIVYYNRKPVWGMNYMGRILKPDLITPAEAGETLMASLTQLYTEDRFLGGFEHTVGNFKYVDTNEGDVRFFQGKEYIYRGDQVAYELVYHGGLLSDE